MPATDRSVSIDRLAELISERRVAVLTGAGISTDSGIPDYRGPRGSLTRRAPIRYHEFVRSAEDRRRYWARSCRGWPFMRDRRPNISHEIVARLQHSGALGPVITQNVDGLHQAAGSDPVLELHGSLDAAVCLTCGHRRDRDAVQREMEDGNPGWLDHAIEIAPDGDAELDPALIRDGSRVFAHGLLRVSLRGTGESHGQAGGSGQSRRKPRRPDRLAQDRRGPGSYAHGAYPSSRALADVRRASAISRYARPVQTP